MASTAKSEARRKTETAMAKRAEDFHHREQALSEIVADYFDANEQAAKIRTAARTKGEKLRTQTDARIAAIRAQAETAASDHDHQAEKAISRMLELGETPTTVATTLGIPLDRVRRTQRPSNSATHAGQRNRVSPQ